MGEMEKNWGLRLVGGFCITPRNGALGVPNYLCIQLVRAEKVTNRASPQVLFGA